ncbi:TRAFAC clade GTPase domain-containing protein [Bifidobacterium jacchi]|uniref:Double-GTPase 2 domain-containing protein n=1 Tax=Bifidobacterium jacchi TaxID=2490545 RepID=A0A5N5REK7_9BIFI|nr:hypothetical protein [Bifidobacterium jacchi]KAB5605340.1 hypothetical protein EHS19_09455 [Bifidobacterium jacchi]
MAGEQEQPARLSYFFGKGYADLWNTIKGAWAENMNSVRMQSAYITQYGLSSPQGLLHLVALICIVVFGTVITAVTSVIHIGVLVVCFCLVYIGFALLWLVDRVYIFFNKINTACPNPNCQANFLIPVYECPNCHVKHTRLVPSKYGILKRTCQCGAKLSTTFLNGRGKLQAYCPVCDSSLSGDTASRQLAVPIIGGISVGKTCYINMAVEQLLYSVAPTRNWEMRFIDDKERNEHGDAMKILSSGHRLPKTDLQALTAYQMELNVPGDKISRRLYVYDIAGEMFEQSSDIIENEAFKYATGLIFMIDPLSLTGYAMEEANRIKIDQYGASPNDFEDILNTLIISLGKLFGLKEKDMLKRNMAVVINKVDIPGLGEKIGDSAVQTYKAAHPEVKTFADARDAVCRRFIDQYGGGSFTRMAESKFKKVRYFTCSALGHNQEGVPYQGEHVIEPLLWVLSQEDPKLKIKGIAA